MFVIRHAAHTIKIVDQNVLEAAYVHRITPKPVWLNKCALQLIHHYANGIDVHVNKFQANHRYRQQHALLTYNTFGRSVFFLLKF